MAGSNWASVDFGFGPLGARGAGMQKTCAGIRVRRLGLVTRRARPAGPGPLCQNEPDSRPGGPCILGPGLVLLLGCKLGLDNGLEWVLEPNKIRKRRIKTKRDSR